MRYTNVSYISHPPTLPRLLATMPKPILLSCVRLIAFDVKSTSRLRGTAAALKIILILLWESNLASLRPVHEVVTDTVRPLTHIFHK